MKWTFDIHNTAQRLFVLTGAGISAESGVRTFRDSGGLWEDHRIEDVATPEGFARDSQLVIDFYNARRLQLKAVFPNPAHLALARLQKQLGERMTLVTQNVDDLHERGGSPKVIHMHGELLKLRCLSLAEHIVEVSERQKMDSVCPQCGAGLRPHITWFGEIPMQMELIQQELLQCSHFVYIGTSSQVYPAAGFKAFAKSRGAIVMCINLDVEPDSHTDLVLQGKAGEVVPNWVQGILAPG
jgi:NAD-dependent deacetylase